MLGLRSLGLGVRNLYSSTASFTIADLFAASEQGAWYDPSDLTSLYQTNAGSTQAVVGSTVGLALDKRLMGGATAAAFIAAQPELVANGGFDSDTAWTKGTGWTISGGTANAAGVTSDGMYFEQSCGLVSGKWYQFSIVTSGSMGGNDYFAFRFGGGSDQLNITTAGTYNGIVQANGSGNLRIRSEASANNLTIDNVTLKLLDGNHALQATAASRPLLGRNPVGGRRNLLTYTEDFSNAVWTKNRSSVSANTVAAPDGTTTADTLVEDGTAGQHFVTQLVTLTATSYTLTAYFKAKERSVGVLSWLAFRANFNLSTGTVSDTAGSPTSTSIVDVGGGWFRCSMTATAAAGATSLIVSMSNSGAGFSYTGDGTSGIYVWGAQLETGSTATAYQKVVTQYDVTEAGVADCYYLAFDGTDDFLVTGAIDFSASDEMSVFAGVRKTAGNNNALIVESSVSSPANNGTFRLSANGGSIENYEFGLRGTTTAGNFRWGLVGTSTNILTMLIDMGVVAPASLADQLQLNIDGVAKTVTGAATGTGNFGNYPFYIGSRGGTSIHFNGRIYSLITRGKLTADTDLTNTEAYVAGKTGVTL